MPTLLPERKFLFFTRLRGLYGAIALSADLWMQIVSYAAIEILPAFLLFRAELSELGFHCHAFQSEAGDARRLIV